MGRFANIRDVFKNPTLINALEELLKETVLSSDEYSRESMIHILWGEWEDSINSHKVS